NFEGMKSFFYAELDVDIDESNSSTQNSAGTQGLLLSVNKPSRTVQVKYGISYISVDQAKENLHMEIPDWSFERVKNDAFDRWDEKLSQILVEGGTLAQKRVFYTALYRCYERMVDINEYGMYYSAYDHRVHESLTPFFVDNWIWDQYL